MVIIHFQKKLGNFLIILVLFSRYFTKVRLKTYFLFFREFFERIILCNSLLWSCEITGKWGLTYQEAVENEERARRNLATFPEYLQRPILYLATLTHRSRMAGMNDDVFVFAKDRYFIGEIVDVVHDGIR